MDELKSAGAIPNVTGVETADIIGSMFTFLSGANYAWLNTAVTAGERTVTTAERNYLDNIQSLNLKVITAPQLNWLTQAISNVSSGSDLLSKTLAASTYQTIANAAPSSNFVAAYGQFIIDLEAKLALDVPGSLVRSLRWP